MQSSQNVLGDSRTGAKYISEGHKLEGNKHMMKGYLFTVAGLICFFEGLPYLAAPDQLKIWLKKICSMETRHLRIMGGILMALGLLFVYWGRRHGG